MDYYQSIIEKYIPSASKNIKSSTRAVKFENTYFSSKAQLDKLLNDPQFLEISMALLTVDSNVPIYQLIYDRMNDYLSSNVDPKITVDIINSTGVFKYSNKLTLEEVFNQPNQNTCPEVMASINFIWGNPMINKTTFPVQPVYPDSVAPMISAGYGLADRLEFFAFRNNQYVAKTWNGLKLEDNQFNDQGPLWPVIMTVRVSQNNIIL